MKEKTIPTASPILQEAAKAPAAPVITKTGFKVVPAQNQPDSYDELLDCVEELRSSIRTINEQAANLVRKIKDSQSTFKRREKDMKAAREAIEKLKVSGF